MTGVPDLADNDWEFLRSISIEPDGTGYVFATQDRDELLTTGLVQALPTPRFDPYGTRVEITSIGREALALHAAATVTPIEFLEAEEIDVGFDFDALLGRSDDEGVGATIDLRPVVPEASA